MRYAQSNLELCLQHFGQTLSSSGTPCRRVMGRGGYLYANRRCNQKSFQMFHKWPKKLFLTFWAAFPGVFKAPFSVIPYICSLINIIRFDILWTVWRPKCLGTNFYLFSIFILISQNKDLENVQETNRCLDSSILTKTGIMPQ